MKKIYKKILDFESKRKYIAFMRAKTKARNIITFYPDDTLKARIKKASRRHGRKVANMCSFIMNDWLNKNERASASNRRVSGSEENDEDSDFLGGQLPSYGRMNNRSQRTRNKELVAA